MLKRSARSWFQMGRLLAVIALVSLVWTGCVERGDQPTDVATQQDDGSAEPTVIYSKANARVQQVMAVQERHTPALMDDPNVVGTGVGLDENGEVIVTVFTESKSPAGRLPVELDGVRVTEQVTGRFVAMKGPPGGGGGGKKALKMGVSGGWRYDLANGYCCGGTLGCLIQVGSQKRILSNYHVFEADIVNGGNGRTAQTGDPIINPGLIDVGCVASAATDVATLVKTGSLPGSNVDCSSAVVIAGAVDESGAIDKIGQPKAGTGVAAFIGQGVKKHGRTTGLTRSTVTQLNATVNVTYENECAGGSAFTKMFTGQIIVSNFPTFIAGGDSGSLMVENVRKSPNAVGLLFAGSASFAVANPIGDVLSFLGATIVGK
jgi:hypothetical protein